MKLNFKTDSIWDNQTIRRYNSTKRFISKFNVSGSVLDIGKENDMGRNLAKSFNLDYTATSCDLDYDFNVKGKYDVIFCFEVLEHLFNPLFCLNNMKAYLKEDGLIFVSVPKRLPHFLCGKNHFHEFDRYRFGYMIENAGLKIINEDVFNSRYDWKFYFTGFRPLLRLLFFKPKSRIYLIRHEKENNK